MIGHVTKIDTGFNRGVITDFHGRNFKFDLAAISPRQHAHLGAEFEFEPQLTTAGLVATNLRHQHHDGSCLVISSPPVTDGQQLIRIGELVLDLSKIQYYEMTTTQNEIRNGYASKARHLLIQMAGGRQFNFYNWDGVNIDEVMAQLARLHTVRREFG